MFSAIAFLSALLLSFCAGGLCKNYYQSVILFAGQYVTVVVLSLGDPLLQVYMITVVIAMLCFLSAQDAEKKCKEMSQKEFLWWLPFFYIPVFNLVMPALWLLDRYQRRKKNV